MKQEVSNIMDFYFVITINVSIENSYKLRAWTK